MPPIREHVHIRLTDHGSKANSQTGTEVPTQILGEMGEARMKTKLGSPDEWPEKKQDCVEAAECALRAANAAMVAAESARKKAEAERSASERSRSYAEKVLAQRTKIQSAEKRVEAQELRLRAARARLEAARNCLSAEMAQLRVYELLDGEDRNAEDGHEGTK